MTTPRFQPRRSSRQASPPGAAVISRLLVVLLALMLLNGCRETEPPTISSPPAVKELIFHTFAGDMPQAVLDAFTQESGITVKYLPFQSPEEAEDNIRAGNRYDVVLIENQLFPALIKEQFLAELDLAQLPNFNNISANFRDLVIDPGNRYSVPASYGTTGLVVRTDLVGDDLKRWADLWNPQYAGKIGLRAQPREIIGMTLTSLGYPFGSENPQELEAALQRLLALKPSVVMLDIEADQAVGKLVQGEIAVLHGYPENYQEAHEKNPAIRYVLPLEGTALWGESYAIPANSTRKQAAARLIDFLLRPEITAEIIHQKKNAQPNDVALPLVKPEIRNNRVIFPDNKDLENGSIILPLSPEGKKLYTDIWTRFMAGTP